MAVYRIILILIVITVQNQLIQINFGYYWSFAGPGRSNIWIDRL